MSLLLTAALLSLRYAHCVFPSTDTEAKCQPGEGARPAVCICSPGFTSNVCRSAADQSAIIDRDHDRFRFDLQKQQFLEEQVPLTALPPLPRAFLFIEPGLPTLSQN